MFVRQISGGNPSQSIRQGTLFMEIVILVIVANNHFSLVEGLSIEQFIFCNIVQTGDEVDDKLDETLILDVHARGGKVCASSLVPFLH